MNTHVENIKVLCCGWVLKYSLLLSVVSSKNGEDAHNTGVIWGCTNQCCHYRLWVKTVIQHLLWKQFLSLASSEFPTVQYGSDAWAGCVQTLPSKAVSALSTMTANSLQLPILILTRVPWAVPTATSLKQLCLYKGSAKSTWGPSTPLCQLAFKAWPLCTVIISWLHLGDLPFTALQHPHWSDCISLIRQVCIHETGWESCMKLSRGHTKCVASWGDGHGLESC